MLPKEPLGGACDCNSQLVGHEAMRMTCPCVDVYNDLNVVLKILNLMCIQRNTTCR